MRPILITIITIGILAFIQDRLVMDLLIPPMMKSSEMIPMFGQALLHGPSVLACIFLGAFAGNHRQVFYMSLSGAAVTMLYAYFSAFRYSVSHSDTWAFNGPVVWWSFGLTIEFFVYFVFMSLGLIVYKHYASNASAT